ncbi:MAG: hypothetical protein N2505_05905 [Endomicrobia bacterium]|nr:hypothetical protein [Endomicrobiia bacterium]
MRFRKQLLKKLSERFEEQYSSVRPDFNEECIRMDVITVIKEKLGKHLNQRDYEKLTSLEATKDSIKFLENFYDKYIKYFDIEDNWLLDLLIELQKNSVRNFNKLLSKGFDLSPEGVVKYLQENLK